MTAIKASRIKSALLKKGFENDHTHHEIFWLCVEGKRSRIRTRLSHGLDEYGDNLLGLMAVQLKLRKFELIELVQCPLTREEYIEILVDRERNF